MELEPFLFVHRPVRIAFVSNDLLVIAASARGWRLELLPAQNVATPNINLKN
jgi:hypothetical protein